MIVAALVALLSAIASFGGALLVRRHAMRLGLMQTPNERSSHTVPTPGGGGVGIVLGGSLATLSAAFVMPWPSMALLLLGLVVAAIGFADDRKPLPARFRLPVQVVVVGLAMWACGSVPALQQHIGLPLPWPVLAVLMAIGVVYWINLFNFMDGIDGIAGSQAMFMLLAALLLAALHVPGVAEQPLCWMMLGVAAASFGFLLVNWPPARIFMGDAGSTYLGFIIAMLGLVSIAAGWSTLLQWAVLSAAFVTDATVTLLLRLSRRERAFEAHRRHAYQALSRRLGGHLPVTLGFIAINIAWLLPLAFFAALPGLGVVAVITAYVPLIGAALYAGAGAPEIAVSRR